jgi:PhzF family phenazine biosynthesis protein
MLSVAAKLGFSETAFVSKSSVATHKVRFFTPTDEVDLCGHATIATWSLMHQRKLHTQGTYTQETLAGVLSIQINEDGLVFMEQAPPTFFETIRPGELTSCLGIEEHDFHTYLVPQIVSTGLRDIMVVVKDEQVLTSIKPDLVLMSKISKHYDVAGLHVVCLLNDQGSIAAARNFAPLVGIPEESATGTSNGALLCYLKEHNMLPNQDIYRIEQGKSMNKLSYIYGRFEDKTVWIGGEATIADEIEIEV